MSYGDLNIEFEAESIQNPIIYISGSGGKYTVSEIEFNNGRLYFQVNSDQTFAVVGYTLLRNTNNPNFGTPRINLESNDGNKAKFKVTLIVGGYVSDKLQDLVANIKISEPVDTPDDETQDTTENEI